MNAAEFARTIASTFYGWREAKRLQDADALRYLTNDLDRMAAEAVEYVKQSGGFGSAVHNVLAAALAPVREAVVPVAQRLTDAKWPT